MSNGCIVCGRSLPLGAPKFCCPGCSAVFSIIEKLNLEGSEKDERISQLLEGVFPGGEDIDSNNNEPNPIEDFILPEINPPASVIPK